MNFKPPSCLTGLPLATTPTARSFWLTAGTLLTGLMLAVLAGPAGAGEDPLTISPASGSTTIALQLTELSGEAGSPLQYSVVVPAGAANLVVATEGGVGAVDLYAKALSPPTTLDYDCLSTTTTTLQNCTIPRPPPGSWHVLLAARVAYSGVTLKVTYETPVALSVSKQGSGNGQVVSQAVQAGFAWPTGPAVVSPQIVGGFNAQNESWPWQVQLTRYGLTHCGGSILSSRWVVTAAHCLYSRGLIPPEALKVRAGSTINGLGGQQVGVQRIIIHEGYDDVPYNNDIALLELESDLLFSASSGPIEPLLAAEEPTMAPEGALATVTGWGATGWGEFGSQTLRQVSVPLIYPAACRSGTYAYGDRITNNMLCAGYRFGEKDACQGDSGGPLVVSNGRGSYVLAGIVSWGEGCAWPDYPGVYTRVANYRGWLEQQTGLAFGQPLIECGTACNALLGLDSIVTLKASTDPGSLFAGWSGDCSGTDNTCQVGMNADKNVTALFARAYTLSVSHSGNGTLQSNPAGILCGTTCRAEFADGASVFLLAEPDPGFALTGWAGDCTGSSTCVVAMNGNKAVSATFTELPKYPVKVIKPGNGVIHSDPAGIDCGGAQKQCTAPFSYATLTATPLPGYGFIKWMGCQMPEGNICSLKPTRKMTVQAVFRKLPKYTLTIRKNTLGSIASAPPGLLCGDPKRSCSGRFARGTAVTLTPLPQAGRSFAGWTGACSGTGPCTVLMDGHQGLGATFQ